MLITIVADVFGKPNNGTAITAKRLIDGLKERGHEVRVVSPFKTEEEGYYTVPIRNFFLINEYIAKNGVELAKPDEKVLADAIAGSDVVHIMMPFKLGQYALKVAEKMGVPCTGGFHCQPENFSSHIFMKDCKPLNDLLYKRFNRVLYKGIKHIHCPSEFIASELSLHGYKSKMHVISNGVASEYKPVDSQKPDERKGQFVILFTGRFAGEKRHDILVKAVAKSKYRDRIQLIFAGKGPKESNVRKLAEKLKINPPVIGLHTPEELNGIINYSDLYVHPAEVEIEAIAALEAITCGLVPVINNSPRSATRFFSLDEHSLFDGTPLDLAQKIDYWIEHPERKAEMSKRYIEYSSRFKLNRCIDLMVDMFEEAAADGRK